MKASFATPCRIASISPGLCHIGGLQTHFAPSNSSWEEPLMGTERRKRYLWAGFGMGGDQARLGFSYGRDGCGEDMWTIRMSTEIRVAREMMR